MRDTSTLRAPHEPGGPSARWRLAPLVGLAALIALSAAPALEASPVAPSVLVAARTGPASAHRYGRELPAVGGVTSSTSEDWSGYATTGSTYTSVAGSWTQPAVTCAAGETSYSAFWVGLDGDTTRTVEQTGTESDCQDGDPIYSAWYEMYPAAPVTIAHEVAPGDTISASVTADGSGGFTLTLSDATAGWSVSTPETASRARLRSAEWIAEAPSNGQQPLPLANFGTVTFTDCTANGSSLGANANLEAISLAARDGTVQAQPSSIEAGGTSFSVTAQPSDASGASGSGSGAGSGTPPSSPYPRHHHHWWQQGGSGQGSSSGGDSSGSSAGSGGGGAGGYGEWPGGLPSSSGAGSPWPSSPWPTF